MIGNINIGADDIARAKAFYDALLLPMGYAVQVWPDALEYSRAVPAGERPHADIYITHPYNEQPASVGNGMMIAFQAHDQAQTRTLHAAALAAGGRDEGAPGFRPTYSPDFYVGYLRDPQGNKIAVYSSNPDDPTRDD
ncbi:MAG: VOC family protein [Pseudomonadota bacterium]